MRERIAVIVSLNFALPLLFGGFCAYAGTPKTVGGEITPSIVYINVFGDKEKFAEDHWIKKGVTGGIEEYSYINENKHGDSIVAEGRALAGNGDYLFDCNLKKEGVGNFIFEFKQFRKYYDGAGGFFSLFTPTTAVPVLDFETDRDLFLNIGNFKVEGIFSKDDFTKCGISYEREYRKGAKSLVSWGPVTGDGYTRYILPTFLEVDEMTDKLDMKIEHTVNDIDVSLEQTWERVNSEIQKVNNRTLTLSTGLFTNTRIKYEELISDAYTTAVRVSKELNEKAFFSTSFLYNHYNGHTTETVTDTSTSTSNENNPNNPANVHQDTVTVLPKVSILLSEHLFMDAGLKWDWVYKDGTGTYNRDKGATPDGLIDEFLDVHDDIEENKLGEIFNLKYDGISNAVFYADSEFGQEMRHERNKQVSTGSSPSSSSNFARDTYAVTYDYASTLGSKFYPMPKTDVTAEFKYKYGLRDYNFNRHTITGDIVNGYRAFLSSISYTSYNPIVMVNFKPFKWFAYNFRYAYDTTIYGIKTRIASDREIASYKANIYSTGATFTPNDTTYLTCYYQYKQARTQTPASDLEKPVTYPLYNANVHTFSTSCSLLPMKNTTVTGSYSFSLANNFDDFAKITLPLGLDNFSQDASIALENKITKDVSMEFKYDFMQYAETSNNGIDNYTAHAFYTALKAKF